MFTVLSSFHYQSWHYRSYINFTVFVCCQCFITYILDISHRDDYYLLYVCCMQFQLNGAWKTCEIFVLLLVRSVFLYPIALDSEFYLLAVCLLFSYIVKTQLELYIIYLFPFWLLSCLSHRSRFLMFLITVCPDVNTNCDCQSFRL